jgi:type II secretory pathway component PulK
MTGDRGFALITALWLIAALTAVVGLGAATTRLGQQTTVNRVALVRGRWAADACLAIAQARWRDRRLADTATIDLGRRVRCSWRVEDPGAIGPESVNVNAASPEVLLTLPGIGHEAVERIVARRTMGRPVQSLDELTGVLSAPGRAAVMAHYDVLIAVVTFAPTRLLVTGTGWVEAQVPRTTIEILTVPLPERLAVIRRRMW